MGSLVAQMVKNLHARKKTWVRKIPWKREWLPTLVFLPESSMDREALLATDHGVSKNQT